MNSGPVARPVSRLSRLEGSARILALIKLANVALTMLSGFAVTYVFVRALPLGEFRAFLLLVAFGNFTVSAELGVTNIVYSRLRRFWLGDGQGDRGTFRTEELGILLLGFCVLILIANLVIGAMLALHLIPTGVPFLFIAFFFLSCLNLLILLLRRGLAAMDRNLLWEGLDLVRRLLTLILLLAILAGLDPFVSVLMQVMLAVIAIVAGFTVMHRRLGMRRWEWLSPRIGGGHVRAHYMRAFGQSAMLTICEVLAYNAPYFTIALATHDARAMLIFDFFFKISRALTITARAMIEAALPRLTAAYYAHRADRFRQLLGRAILVSLAAAIAAGVGLLLLGPHIFRQLFDGKAVIGRLEIGALILLLCALSVTCVSVYVQGALGRFGLLLRQSMPFLAGSLFSVPLAWALAKWGGMDFTDAFLILYTMTFAGTALLHARSMQRLNREVAQAEGHHGTTGA